eukprot:6206270-Pleurochrysis_carterae.AAC.4
MLDRSSALVNAHTRERKHSRSYPAAHPRRPRRLPFAAGRVRAFGRPHKNKTGIFAAEPTPCARLRPLRIHALRHARQRVARVR